MTTAHEIQSQCGGRRPLGHGCGGFAMVRLAASADARAEVEQP